ncbi:MAG TPA: CBS domain-containing protein [Caldilineaceae bacterium]|nr:CBS domain-containing protein [Caldilineaceae bacterium]
MHRIPVRQIMQSNVITIRPEELVADAAQVMEEFNIRRLPVVDEDNCVVGIVTDSDVREAEAADGVRSAYEPGVELEWLTVGDIMTREVITIGPDATLGELASVFMRHKVGGVPVVEPDPHKPKRQRLIGIVTETDIFAMIVNAWQKDRLSNQATNEKALHPNAQDKAERANRPE